LLAKCVYVVTAAKNIYQYLKNSDFVIYFCSTFHNKFR